MFHFSLNSPTTKAAQQAQSQAQESFEARLAEGEEPLPIGQALVPLIDNEVLCVVSQTCDIDANEEVEPFVEVVPAYEASDEQEKRNADRNSARRFLLCPERELIIDATRRFTLEKAVLKEYEPDNPTLDEVRERRLRRFLSRRGGRAALDDGVVKHVTGPIDEVFSKKRLRSALEPLVSIRIDHLEGSPPYIVQMTFLTSRDLNVEEEEALEVLVGEIDKQLRKGSAHLESWSCIQEEQIALGAFRATDEVYLEHYTYRGEEIVGEEPVEEE